MQVDTQDRFYNEIHDMSTKNSSANNALFSKERIETLKGGVKQAKDAMAKHIGQRGQDGLHQHPPIITCFSLDQFFKVSSCQYLILLQQGSFFARRFSCIFCLLNTSSW
jgi:hypothetical protein